VQGGEGEEREGKAGIGDGKRGMEREE